MSDNIADLVARLVDYVDNDDHERLCQGREYSCTCGYDDKRDPLLREAAQALTRIAGERDEASETLSRVEYSDGDAEHWRNLFDRAEALAQAAEVERDRLAALVEQAFRDGIAYATNTVVTDVDLAWAQSRAREALRGAKP